MKLSCLFTYFAGVLLISCAGTFSGYSQAFKVLNVSDLSRVYEDGYHLNASSDTVRIFGIRGEVVSGQVAVNALKKISDLTCQISALVNPQGISLAEKNIEWSFVGSILLPANAPNQPEDAVERKAPARFPDYLMPDRKINLGKGMYQGIWLTVRLPEDAVPGSYSGSVKVTSSSESQSIPVKITVYPLTLPDQRHLKIAVRYSVNNFDKYHGTGERYSASWFSMLRKYAENMAEHRQNVMQAPMDAIEITKTAEGGLTYNFTHYDDIVRVFMNTGKFDFIETGYGLTKFGNEDWFSTEILLSDFKVRDAASGNMITLPGEEVVPSLLPAFERHLRQMGWLDKALLSVRNEPSVHNFRMYDELSDYFHELAPDLKQFESIETTMYGGLDIPGPKLDHLATWYDKFREDQEKGKEICYYIVGIYQGGRFPDKTIDMPVMDSRIMPWLNYKYNLSGIKHWGWNSWTDDPFNVAGQHLGDGWHVYPVKDGLLNSLRWEEMRNGIQDYECLRMLENRVTALKDSLGSQFSWIDPRQRGVELSGVLVKSFSERTNDPALLYDVRKRIINEIIDFDISPEVYIQTNPIAGTELTSGSTVEVFGWAEPGTKITVNRKILPVREDGLFLEQFSLNQRNNRIAVIAVKDGKTKQLVREFRIR